MMKVRIVSYEDVNAWILGKIARKLHEEVLRAGVACSIGGAPDPAADINHHIIYINYPCAAASTDTMLITHIDTLHKLQLLKKQLATSRMGICFSRETQTRLISAGLSADRLCHINPAHDEVIKPRRLALGITSNVHADGRKNEAMILNLCSRISHADFRFIIMGAGWNGIVPAMRAKGFQVDHYDAFDYDKYTSIVPSFDYYLYVSHDEGSMGFLDALSAGVRTLVTPQGFHLDAAGGLTRPVNNEEDLVAACLEIAEKRRALVRSVASWTWPNYARKHIDLWRFLLEGKSAQRLPGEPYPDGLASICAPGDAPAFTAAENAVYKAGLLKNSSRTFYNYFPEGKISLPILYAKAAKRIKRMFGK